jgi:hypothetical protein
MSCADVYSSASRNQLTAAFVRVIYRMQATALRDFNEALNATDDKVAANGQWRGALYLAHPCLVLYGVDVWHRSMRRCVLSCRTLKLCCADCAPERPSALQAFGRPRPHSSVTTSRALSQRMSPWRRLMVSLSAARPARRWTS